MNLTPEQIANCLGGVPANRVATQWPLVEAALAAKLGGMLTDRVRIAALATIRVECPPFLPVNEVGDDAYFVKMYWTDQNVAKALGNEYESDAVLFHGRGLIQITGRWNYQHFGALVHQDLITNPGLALDQKIAAQIFAEYFVSRGCAVAANEELWTLVRRHVNGGLNGLQPFIMYVVNLALASGLVATSEIARLQGENYAIHAKV